MKGNVLSGPLRAERQVQRLAWLRAHPALLARLPGIHDDVEPVQSEALDEAVRQMKHVRLYAPTSAPIGVRRAIRTLVSELRGEDSGMRE